MTSDRDFAEKRFNGSGAFRAAATYAVTVVALAGVAFAFYAFGARDSVYAAALVPLFLFIGGVGAIIRTYREWKAGHSRARAGFCCCCSSLRCHYRDRRSWSAESNSQRRAGIAFHATKIEKTPAGMQFRREVSAIRRPSPAARA